MTAFILPSNTSKRPAAASAWFIENLIPRNSIGLLHSNPELDNDRDLMGAHIHQKRPLVYLALDLLLHIDHARVSPTKFRRQYKCYPANILFITEWFKSDVLKRRIADQSLSRGWKLPTVHFNFIAGERVDLFDAPTLDELREIIEENNVVLLVLDSDPMRLRGTEKAWHKAITSLQDSVSTILDVSFFNTIGESNFSLTVGITAADSDPIPVECVNTVSETFPHFKLEPSIKQNEQKASMKWEK